MSPAVLLWTATAEGSAAKGSSAQGPPAEQRAAEERGRTRIEPRVVERIAAAVAAEVEGVVGGPRRMLGLGRGSSADVSATIHGTSTEIALTVALCYPSRAREVAAALRGRVIERVEELTGMRVSAVDLRIARLLPDAPAKVR